MKFKFENTKQYFLFNQNIEFFNSSNTNNNQKILIFGGAFNPPHNCHLQILQAAIDYIKPTKIIICIDKDPTLWKGKTADFTPYFYREQMVKNLFPIKKDYCIIFNNNKNFLYISEIIKEIAEKNKNSELYYLIGQDEYETITTWQGYNDINLLTTIVCYKRGNKQINSLFDKHIILPNKKIIGCSHEIRENISQYLNNKNSLLNDKNCQFIKTNHLYLQYQIKNKCEITERRYFHTLSVLETITKIALGNNFNDIDILKCQQAAILHDIAKNIYDDSLVKLSENFLNRNDIQTKNFFNKHPHCLHGYVGCKLAQKIFGITDETILEAINNHVIFQEKKANSNKIAKALYCADKLEPNRTEQDFPHHDQLLNECINNLEKSFPKVLKTKQELYKQNK